MLDDSSAHPGVGCPGAPRPDAPRAGMAPV